MIVIGVTIVVLKILIAILVFGLIIFVHELGHFLVAKLMGVKVNEFAMGMGPKLFSFGRGETTYSLRLLPIGGFCAMEGEDAAGAGEVKLKEEGEAAGDTVSDTGEPGGARDRIRGGGDAIEGSACVLQQKGVAPGADRDCRRDDEPDSGICPDDHLLRRGAATGRGTGSGAVYHHDHIPVLRGRSESGIRFAGG